MRRISTILPIILLLSSILVYLEISNATTSTNLTVTPISTFSGQIEGSTFTSNGTLFAGDTRYHLYRSDDNGSSFRLIYTFSSQPGGTENDNIAGYMVNVFSDSRNYIFVSIPGTNRLYRSVDFGSSFTEVLNTNGTVNDGLFLGITEDSQGNIYTSTYCNSIYPNLPQLFKSTDGGATWRSVLTVRAEHIHNVAFNPYNNYLYVDVGEWAGSPYDNTDCESVWRSRDFGQTWTKIITRTNPNGYGDTIYWAMVFQNSKVFFGTDEAYRVNWIAMIDDDGRNSLFSPQTVYTFPSNDGYIPITCGAKLNDTMVFVNSPEFYDGVSHIVASTDGVNWEDIKSYTVTTAQHTCGVLSNNPKGILFGSSGIENYIITQNPNPQPTPSPTPTPTPNPSYLFSDSFESGNTNSWTGTKSYGSGVSLTVQTSTKFEGNYGLQAGLSGNSGERGRCIYKDLGTSYSTLDSRVYIKLSSAIPVGTQVCLIGYSSDGWIPNAVGTRIDLYNDNGTSQWLLLYYSNGWQGDLIGAVNSDGWYCIETRLIVGNGNGEIHFYVNGTEIATHKGLYNNGQSVRFLSLGADAEGSANLNVFYDALAASTSYIGPIDNPKPNPTPTPSPTPTSTPSPTPTPTPSPSPTATPTPSPLPTPASLMTALQVKANVTVTSVNFQTNYRLYITINKVGVNQIEATIAKTMLPNIANLRVYINSSQKSFTYIDNGDSWVVTVFTT